MGDPTDEQLMERFCTRGDKPAFAEVFDRFAHRVRAFLRPMVHDPALAEDLTQTTFLSIVRSRDRYLIGSPVAPWIFTIAANAARDALRRRRIEQKFAPEAEEAVVHSEPADHGLRRQLESALQELPVSQREVVVLHKVQGLSFEQVAAAIGITSTAARIRAHRGYVKLRSLLAHLDDAS
jgi:RNA polymerase sigma factor (sigma-70 family)